VCKIRDFPRKLLPASADQPYRGDREKNTLCRSRIRTISQAAFLPGFKNAKNSVLAALVSDDSKKLNEVAKRCRVHASSPSGR
jgi:hypothetical protein